MLDINAASWSDIAALDGIELVDALRICHDRALHGPFAGPEDLLRVPGTTEAKLSRLRGSVSFTTTYAGGSNRMLARPEHAR